jgi:hypothetical protein
VLGALGLGQRASKTHTPSVLCVSPSIQGTFIFGVDMIQRIFVTLDKMLPSNAYLTLQVDYDKYTNIDVSVD